MVKKDIGKQRKEDFLGIHQVYNKPIKFNFHRRKQWKLMKMSFLDSLRFGFAAI